MPITPRFAGFVLLSLSLVLPASQPVFAAGVPARGKEIAEKKCAICHAIGTTGESPNPKSPAFRTLSERYPIDSLQESLAEGITVGHEGVEMPEFRMEPREIDDFLSYLKSINKER